MNFEFSQDYAQEKDSQDSLKSYRKDFVFPSHLGEKVLYFTGNSLGLMPKKVRDYMNEELDDWGFYGVDGHFESRRPWYSYHEQFAKKMSALVGAKPHEVVLMNGLSVNLHLMMVSFYQPTSKRYKILCEKKAFPSDQYMLETQAKFHGFDPQDAIIEIEPSEGEIISEADIFSALEENKDEVALIFIGGVNYYTGQYFNIQRITEKAHEYGITAGFDLAHAAGNVVLELHDWDVDFACWCTYKYLNSGPGSISGVFVNEKHARNPELFRFGGWWGHDKSSRFLMEPGFKPMPTAEGWQLSNAPVLCMTPLLASLELFDSAGMSNLRAKADLLTSYLEFIVTDIDSKVDTKLEILTPKDPSQRGSQLSIVAHGHGKSLFDKLTKEGVIVDWREPNVIRMAPVPLYNSFEDVYDFGVILLKLLSNN